MSGGRYQAYPKYKDSGEYWLGRIPNTWHIARHKYVATFNKGKNPSTLLDFPVEGAVPYLSMDFLRGVDAPKYAMPKHAAYVAKRGQVLIIWDGSNAGEFIKGRDGILSSTMAAAEITNEIIPRYYWYACACLEPEMRKHATGMGIPHVNGDELKSSLIPTPSLPEQTQIAAFLDHETAKIDRLIEKQQALISLLKEKRQAVISHAVTKGLNPHAPLKDSGIEWLGQVPAGWKTSELRYEVKPDTSITYGIVQAGPDVEGGIPYIKTSDMSGDSLPLNGYAKTSSAIASSFSRSMVAENDIVIAIRASVGKCHLVPAHLAGANLTQGTAKISPAHEHSFEFFYWYLSSDQAQAYFDSVAKGATFREITLEKLRKTPIALPPIEEQQMIVGYIRKQHGRFSALLAAAEKQTTLLQERRTALISAAVTGKIDVRHWQPPAVLEPSA